MFRREHNYRQKPVDDRAYIYLVYPSAYHRRLDILENILDHAAASLETLVHSGGCQIQEKIISKVETVAQPDKFRLTGAKLVRRRYNHLRFCNVYATPNRPRGLIQKFATGC